MDPRPRPSILALILAALLLAAPALAQERYLGEILLVGFTFCPRGSVEANGQVLAIAQNQALFSLYGTTYGGDGRTTFALPDLRGRVPVHTGSGPGLSSYPQGQPGGAETTTLSEAQLPAHTHSATTDPSGLTVELRAAEEAPNSSSAADAALAEAQVYTNEASATPSAALKTGSAVIGGSATTTVDSAGGGQAFDTRQPFLTLRYCVVLSGVFPPRN